MNQDVVAEDPPEQAGPLHARRWMVLGTLCASLLVVMLANSSLNLALPTMSTQLSLTSLQQTWIVDVYSLLFAALLLTSGAVGDRYGRKRIMQLGLVIFLGASVFAGAVASTGLELIVARALMGVGAAMVMPATLSIVTVVFDADERPRAIATWTAVAGVGVAFGSVLSGFLLEHFSWQSTFLVSAAVVVVALVANHWLVPESRDGARTPVDLLGAVLSTGGLVGVVYAIIEGPSLGLTDPGVLLALIGGVVLLLAFVGWELRSSHPMLDMRLLRRPSFGISSLAVTLASFALMGVFFVMSQLFQLVMGYGAMQSSLAMLPVMAPMLLLSPVVPRVVERVGARWAVGAGLAVVAIGFATMATWPTVPSYWQVLGGMLIMVVGMSFVLTPATTLMMTSVPPDRSGMGSAMNDTTRELGGTLGVAVLGAVMSATYAARLSDATAGLGSQVAQVTGSSLSAALDVASELGAAGGQLAAAAKDAWMSGLSTAMVIAALICLAAALIAARWLPGRRPADRPESPGPTCASEAAAAPRVEAGL